MTQNLHNGLHIHLTQANPAQTLSNDTILDATEQQRARRFIYDKDRQLFVTAHAFLRETLSQYAPIAPADWTFQTNDYGKPAISNPGYENLQFNLSHTQGLVAVAVTQHKTVGVDVEQSTRNVDLPSLSRHVFASSEVDDVLSTDDAAIQRKKFFTYWTLKEAYIKARGKGLSIPLKKFWFQPTNTRQWLLNCDPSLQDQGDQWLCHAISLEQDYFLAYVVPASIDPSAIQIHLPNAWQSAT